MKPIFHFTFDGRRGAVFPHGSASWGGAFFQIEAAGSELRAAIEAARK